MESIKPDQMYRTREVSKFLAVSDSTVQRLIKRNDIESLKIGGNRRLKGQHILNYMDKQSSLKS